MWDGTFLKVWAKSENKHFCRPGKIKHVPKTRFIFWPLANKIPQFCSKFQESSVSHRQARGYFILSKVFNGSEQTRNTVTGDQKMKRVLTRFIFWDRYQRIRPNFFLTAQTLSVISVARHMLLKSYSVLKRPWSKKQKLVKNELKNNTFSFSLKCVTRQHNWCGVREARCI